MIVLCSRCSSLGSLEDGSRCPDCDGHGSLNSSLIAAQEWLEDAP